jgi:hypothetical protein
MDHRTNKGRVSLSIAIAVALLGCGGDPDTTARVAGDEPIGEHDEVIVCGDASVRGNVYVRPAIEAKFAHYPAFAEYAGLSTIESCDDARAFSRAYDEYSKLHPGFDDDQPLGVIAETLPEPSDGFEPTLELPKITGTSSTPVTTFPNWGFPNSPIVQMTRIVDANTTDSCSGTFIAKNWILTAAHCLAVTKPSATFPKRITGWVFYTIDWPTPTGDLHTGVRLVARALQYPHPDYTGGNSFVRDIALLYLPERDYDRLLPPDPSAGSTMRISRVPPVVLSGGQPDPSHPNYFAGYGRPSNTLRVVAGVVPETSVNQHQVLVTSPDQGRVCRGDSGGPLFGTGTLGGVVNVPRLMGTLSGHAPTLGVDCAPVGDRQVWQRVDLTAPRQNNNFTFITAQMKKWYGKNFECQPGNFDDSPVINDFVQCWGKACQQDSECGTDAYCSRPREDFDGEFCPRCQGCGCLVGQCLPNLTF